MAWDPTLLEDGDDANAASINTPLQLGEAWLNALDRDGIRAGALGPDHAGSIAHRFAPVTIGSHGDIITYTTANFGTSIEYASFGADGGTDAAGVRSGDRAVLGHPDCPGYIGTRARVDLPGPLGSGYLLGMDTGSQIAAVLVLLNAELYTVDTNGGTIADASIMVCLQFQINGNSGAWYTIDNSERFLSVDDHKLDDTNDSESVSFDFPIACLITPAMIDNIGDHEVDMLSNVRAMVAYRSSAALPGTVGFEFNHWNMTVMPIYSADVG